MATTTSTMFYGFLFFTWFITTLLLRSFIKTRLNPKKAVWRPPPSPPALPFIGHLHLLTSVLPTTFQTLAHRYGPLMQLRIGTAKCVVASDTAVAKEIFKTQDLNFSSRPEFGSSEYFIYRGSRFVMAQYGEYWRFMKKLCMTRLLAVPQLDKFLHIREQEVTKLVESLMERSREGKPADMTMDLTTLTNNIICRMAMSARCSGTSNDAKVVKDLVKECLVLAGKLSVGDAFGPLKVFNMFGNGKMMISAVQRYDQLVERIMKEHEEKAMNGCAETEVKDLMDILLEIQKDPCAEVKLSRVDIKSFLLDVFMAGTDTSSAAMQWAMAHLINNPKMFNKLREEINSVVGTNRLVKESDIPNLPFLRAVVRETLRLHPSAPLIIRECAEDCKINGYDVKAKTRVLVNVFAIMRDPNEWKDPNEFMPERFLVNSGEKIGEHQMEIKGQNFRYLPFGSGRRGCPGASLALLVMHVTIGALVQCFDWKVKGGEKASTQLGTGFAAEMAHRLVCYPITRSNPL
ncbi:hypothetical protein L1049_008146 [Liquidambar formosana]|uniref:3,9-dihydroxypterocarpan 6A-monooxygenase n=1 Tax=Liquidambar formosana TaxID=63359 RepID=A0AAP0SAC3_LIQFO